MAKMMSSVMKLMSDGSLRSVESSVVVCCYYFIQLFVNVFIHLSKPFLSHIGYCDVPATFV